MSTPYDVLIVGAGPVGVVLARLLGQLGVRTLLVDRERDVLRIPRAIALDDDGGRVLQSIGEYARLRRGLPRIERIRLLSPQVGEVFSCDASRWRNANPMLLMFRQPELEDALREGLSRSPAVTFRTGLTFASLRQDEEGAAVTFDAGEVVRARFVVGCDGARSAVRRAVGVDMVGSTYAREWLVVDVRHDPTPNRELHFLGDPSRPGVTMPAPRGGRRWEFMLRPGDDRAALTSPAALAHLLAPWGDVERMEVERAAIYTFHARVASRMQVGRVLLAGDAAHLTPPFVGQGLMAGLRDVHNLAWKLAAVVHGAAPALLGTYEIERLPNVKAMVCLAQAFGELIMADGGVRSVLRDHVLRSLSRLPGVRSTLGTLDIKPRTRIERGLLRPRRGPGSVRPGDLMPQCTVQGDDVRPLDERIGYRWALIGIGIDPMAWLRRDQQAWWPRLGASLRLSEGGEADVDGALSAAAPKGTVLVARPDRHLFDVCPARELEHTLDELGRWLAA
jgi:3-(3-hydroxy-phenyl)propionate hydroxylase